MIHGYAKRNTAGDFLLGFQENASCFQHAQGQPVLKLIEATGNMTVVAYSVVKQGEAHGFLWSIEDIERAEQEAVAFTERFGTPYTCIPLAIQ